MTENRSIGTSAAAELERADALLESNAFAESRDAYRRALLEDPRVAALANLVVAEQQERLAFARELAARFPDNLDVRLAEVLALEQAGHWQQAVALCSAMLGGVGDEAKQLAIRSRRLSAASSAQDWSTWAQDALALWEAGAAAGRQGLRRQVVRRVAGLDKVGAASALRRLAEEADAELQPLLRAKAAELEAAEHLMR